MVRTAQKTGDVYARAAEPGGEELAEMHDLFQKGYTPKVRPKKGCTACSLKELCLPRLMKKTSVSDYIGQQMEDGL